MDAIVPLALAALAFLGLIATLAGVESRDGFSARDTSDPTIS